MSGGGGVYNVPLEVNKVRLIPPNRGYVDVVWSAGFRIQDPEQHDYLWDERYQRPRGRFGSYQICVGDHVIIDEPIYTRSQGTPKITGAGNGVTVARPGDSYVVGNGSTIQVVNIGSDRPHRGDTLKYTLASGVSALITIAVVTFFNDNLTDTNQYNLFM